MHFKKDSLSTQFSISSPYVLRTSFKRDPLIILIARLISKILVKVIKDLMGKGEAKIAIKIRKIQGLEAPKIKGISEVILIRIIIANSIREMIRGHEMTSNFLLM